MQTWKTIFKDEKCVHIQFSLAAEIIDTSELQNNQKTIISQRPGGYFLLRNGHYNVIIKRAYKVLGMQARTQEFWRGVLIPMQGGGCGRGMCPLLREAQS